MSHPVINRKLAFKRPTIGKKHYISVGSGGWAESFDRKTCDASLAQFIGNLSIDELANNFIEAIRLSNQKEATWQDVTKYLGRIFSLKADEIDIDVAIGFWAVVVQIEDKGVNS